MDVTLHVPVPGFVYKYCAVIFKEKGRQFYHWRLSQNAKEGKVVYSMLQRVPHRYEKYARNECILPIMVPSKMARLKGCYLTQENIDIFIDYIKQVIMDEILYFHTGIQTRIGLKVIDKISVNQYKQDQTARVVRLHKKEVQKFFWQKSIISDILKKYDITEDDISTDSIVKYLQRHSTFHYSA